MYYIYIYMYVCVFMCITSISRVAINKRIHTYTIIAAGHADLSACVKVKPGGALAL